MNSIGGNPQYFSKEDSIKPLIEALKNYLPDLQFDMNRQSLGGVYVDVLLKIYDIPLAVIEYANYDERESAFEYAVCDVSNILQHSRIDIGIVTDNLGCFFLYESYGFLFESKSYGESRVNVNKIIQCILNKAGDYKKEPDMSNVVNVLGERYAKKNYLIQQAGNEDDATRFFTDGCKNLQKSPGEFFMPNEYEVNFFKALLGNIEPPKICRYTTLNSLLSIINDKKILMNGLASMNDSSEMHYTDYLFPWYSSIKRDIESIKKDNSIFALSCSRDGSIDDLTLWRLYGDDSRGVCIEFDIDYSKVDNNQFFIFPVYYFSIWTSTHSILELFRELQEEPIETGWYFTFKNWDVWRAFFKSSHYHIENEVRLLYRADGSKQDYQTFID